MELQRVTGGFGLLEGARWYDDHGLVFSDMTRGGVHQLNGESVETVIPHRKGIGGLVAHADGGWVVSGRNVAHRPPVEDGIPARVLLEPQADEQFFNDLTADGTGRVYVGAVSKDTALHTGHAPGRLYEIGLLGDVRVLAADVLTSNGLGMDPTDQYLYHVDSPRRVVWRFDTFLSDPAGTREVFVDTAEYDGVPDGLAIAVDGSLWLAIAGGSVVVAWDASGAKVQEIEVPQPLVTSVCFGGTERTSLFVLTGVDDEHPDDAGGCVYRTPASVAGLPAPFARVPSALA
jgi:D-xylonolactonase